MEEPVTLDEFVDRLDKNNPFYAEFVGFIRRSPPGSFLFERKSRNIADHILDMEKKDRFPVIDKKHKCLSVLMAAIMKWFEHIYGPIMTERKLMYSICYRSERAQDDT